MILPLIGANAQDRIITPIFSIFPVIELDVGEIPSPINDISCLSQSLCFPAFDGVYVNPTSRLAFVGKCIQLCEGILTYEWTILNEEYSIETVK